MSDYLKSTNFATKDSLPSGNAGKIVKGTEIDNEFNAIADAVESKADLLNPVFSGLLTTDTLATVGAANIGGTLAVAGTFSAAGDAQFTGTGRMLFPKGTTAQRPASPTSGSVRYNTDLGYLENYNGTVWRAVGYVTPADVSDQANTSTGYFQVSKGTDVQRSFTPATGLVRYNTTQNIYEGYTDVGWIRFVVAPQGNYTITYLMVAGGGGGGCPAGTASSGNGGGGAGGMTEGTLAAIPTTTYTISIGAGGSGSSSTKGANSSISGIALVYGGGAGGGAGDVNGGSGGGGFGNGSGGGSPTVAGQGNAGGTGSAFWGSGAGGGGAGTAGNNGGSAGGAGGSGAVSTITGTAVTYAGGGGGDAPYTPDSPFGTGGAGGSGGGGAGGNGFNAGGSAGSPNSGGGGGALRNGSYNGGSGVVILSMPTASYTGNTTGLPIVSTVGSNTVLRYTNSGTYVA
jgi:hypothetical protein